MNEEMGIFQVNKPEDQRVRLTKAMIQTAFLQLMAEKPIQSITVKELCQRAEVNRGTFYMHYRDIYDLLETMETTLLEDLDRMLERAPVIGAQTPSAEAAGLFEGVYRFVEKNRELCAVLLGEGGDRRFIAVIIDHAREKSLDGYGRLFPQVSRRDAELYFTFIAWGFVGLLQHSLQHPETVDLRQMAEGAQRIIESSAGYFLQQRPPRASTGD